MVLVKEVLAVWVKVEESCGSCLGGVGGMSEGRGELWFLSGWCWWYG